MTRFRLWLARLILPRGWHVRKTPKGATKAPPVPGYTGGIGEG